MWPLFYSFLKDGQTRVRNRGKEEKAVIGEQSPNICMTVDVVQCTFSFSFNECIYFKYYIVPSDREEKEI